MLNSTGTEVCINLTNTYNNRKFFSFSWLCRKLSYTYPFCLPLILLRSFVSTLSYIFLLSVSKQAFEFPMWIFSLRKHSISTHFSGGCSKSNKFSRVWYECVCVLIEWFNRCQSVNPSLFIFVFSLSTDFFPTFFFCSTTFSYLNNEGDEYLITCTRYPQRKQLINVSRRSRLAIACKLHRSIEKVNPNCCTCTNPLPNRLHIEYTDTNTNHLGDVLVCLLACTEISYMHRFHQDISWKFAYKLFTIYIRQL